MYLAQQGRMLGNVLIDEQEGWVVAYALEIGLNTLKLSLQAGDTTQVAS